MPRNDFPSSGRSWHEDRFEAARSPYTDPDRLSAEDFGPDLEDEFPPGIDRVARHARGAEEPEAA